MSLFHSTTNRLVARGTLVVLVATSLGTPSSINASENGPQRSSFREMGYAQLDSLFDPSANQAVVSDEYVGDEFVAEQYVVEQYVADEYIATESYMRGKIESLVESSRRDVALAFERADEKINTLTPDEQALWRSRLGWDELQATINDPVTHVQALRGIQGRFFGVWEGLETKELVQLREAIIKLNHRLEVALDPNPAESYAYHRQMIELAIQSWDEQGPASNAVDVRSERNAQPLLNAADVARSLAWLESAEQNPELISLFKQRYRIPSVIVGVDRKLAMEQLSELHQSIDEVEYRRNNIVGAVVQGNVHTKAEVDVVLDESSEEVGVKLSLEGVAESPYNVASKGPVRLYSSGVTQISAQTRLSWSGTGLQIAPVDANCQTDTRIIGSSVERGRLFQFSRGGVLDSFIQGFAEKQAGKKQTQAECEGNQIAERAIRTRMTNEANKLLEEANGQVDEYFYRPMVRTGLWCAIAMRSVDHFVGASFKTESPGYWGAERYPDLSDTEAVMVLSAHQNAMNSMLQPLVGGMRWEDRDFSSIQNEILGDRSYEMRIGLHERWSMVFDWWQPWRAEVDADGVTTVLRGTSVRIGDRDYDGTFEIRARYSLESIPALGPEFVRQGNVEVSWPSDSVWAGEHHVSDKSKVEEFLVKKFSGFFLERFYMDGLTVPAGGKWGELSDIRVVGAQTEQGWLTFIIRDASKKAESTSTETGTASVVD